MLVFIFVLLLKAWVGWGGGVFGEELDGMDASKAFGISWWHLQGGRWVSMDQFRFGLWDVQKISMIPLRLGEAYIPNTGRADSLALANLRANPGLEGC